MPHRKAPLPRRAGGRREERSLIVRACRAFVDHYANLLRLGLIVGGIHLMGSLVDNLSPRPVDPASAGLQAVERPAAADTSEDDAKNAGVRAREPLSDVEKASMERIRHVTRCTQRDYQRKHYSDCGLADSEIYRQEDIFKDDGSLTIFDVETLYAETR